ncbi:hypothetical protein [Phycicoccus sonneratiae]|uniref:Lipoprotein n=1 Tax=Phycicoccus sonneratiae TaxID=2807628 RepID=A0ABS2CQ77_9MICO|nr:hypothetical protein [Phycicoccus sonneraticus]MBM6401978.1 hypothetical protein [Phycicoccus sonneraticus]
MRRGAWAGMLTAGVLLAAGCSADGDRGAAGSASPSVTAATADPATAADPAATAGPSGAPATSTASPTLPPAPTTATGPADLPPRADATMDPLELRLAQRLAQGEGEAFPPSTCGVVRVAARGDDVFGWGFCSTEYGGATSMSSGVVGIRHGHLWAPQDGARHQDDLVRALGATRAAWVLDHEAELGRTAEQRHG